ncbi:MULTISPECIES: NADH-quinone oxidoreductase subunit C [unclassified Lysobacter]|uniref:NADH-quinone oxidoreductase subunit C n=1 Tax=unclassified Lysobacter TaxID=2635362 RepID=UPI001BE5DFA9|nr:MULTISPECIES: NADH-quinone oxidoreductase subunit C [unclassified Lysobacter]MBT2745244.1 NADH-quinone oxidoreductase subunit C [Lysobacter sp. ISL-42]MBT2751841.1 NADH-quinone oxidoreductase subunit C [Lysobacter sp. ISL-50]MBT2777806.1 NADH-quinone oxidoreductase subunit C [Lysobacter sp. ISL-54]MBT2783062.1 NADH-quinone oxidoreductase subunit C [Lysobacter sp. ISL-52]
MSAAPLAQRLSERFAGASVVVAQPRGEITLEVAPAQWLAAALALRDEFGFEQCVDVSGVDYLSYGSDEWDTDVSSEGFSRGVEGKSAGRFRWGESPNGAEDSKPARRFAAVAHLLSCQHNQRVRLKTFADNDDLPVVGSLSAIWPGVNWFEREAFDLYGIIFEGHPDLRRILTDYGFVGHPFRKDFPLIGNVEVRYDAEKRRVVYEPVSIEPRVGVPRVIRDDARYQTAQGETAQRDAQREVK